MCGLSGFYKYFSSEQEADKLLNVMGAVISHRGPDDSGTWFDKTNGVGFSHRRLAIVDLTAAGHQPMHSYSGKYVIAFNGEIYNHVILRGLLEKEATISWNGSSDTETLLQAFEIWGVEKTIEQTIGMFAMAVWNTVSNKLTLIRDRLGEKPLYYGWQNDTLIFGSELSSIKLHPKFEAEIDRNALSMYMRQGYISSPYSIYQGIKKLNAGTMIHFDVNCEHPEELTYWSASNTIIDGAKKSYQGTLAEAVTELEGVLGDAVERQMAADVPLGAFLSGGVDSSTIVALMQLRSSKPVKTFSIGFHEEGYNEALYAKEVARHLGTEHTELYATTEDALAVIPHLASIYSEPFADSSQIPTYLVSKMAKEHVTVSLSGDGGDELFSGYSRYKRTADAWNKIQLFPVPVRKLTAFFLKSVPTSFWDRLFSFHSSNFGDQIHKGADALKSTSFENFYANYLMAHTREPEHMVIGGRDPLYSQQFSTEENSLGLYDKMSLLDLKTYMIDDILCKVDRAAMAVSLETRVPLLDHTVVEFTAKLTMNIKRLNGGIKWPLRQILYKYVPKELIERPKKGFGIPLEKWLREGLRDWADNLLDFDKISEQGYLNPMLVEKLWNEHKEGKRNWSYILWNILMFQAWLENQ